MQYPPESEIVFMILVSSSEELRCARRLIASLRDFGGVLSRRPVWLFAAGAESAPCQEPASESMSVIPLQVPENLRAYLFGAKVAACAAAEAMARERVRSLVYLTPECLILQPPTLFVLDQDLGAALRPVHIRNVGSPVEEAPDDFWRGVFAATGVEDLVVTVNSFVEDQPLRAYFNSGAFSIDPSLGIFQDWLRCFEALVLDHDFQARACADQRHRIFLHQAVLSSLLASRLPLQRIRFLPPTYGYPYHLQTSIPLKRRAAALEELVCVIYDEVTLDPDKMMDIQVGGSLQAWLSAHLESHPS
ncbi:MAG: hypothetical protein PHD58_08415 [Anaerolineales bacterium]|nr:hypothetical protein [Anaerolineales bacterium]